MDSTSPLRVKSSRQKAFFLKGTIEMTKTLPCSLFRRSSALVPVSTLGADTILADFPCPVGVSTRFRDRLSRAIPGGARPLAAAPHSRSRRGRMMVGVLPSPAPIAGRNDHTGPSFGQPIGGVWPELDQSGETCSRIFASGCLRSAGPVREIGHFRRSGRGGQRATTLRTGRLAREG